MKRNVIETDHNVYLYLRKVLITDLIDDLVELQEKHGDDAKITIDTQHDHNGYTYDDVQVTVFSYSGETDKAFEKRKAKAATAKIRADTAREIKRLKKIEEDHKELARLQALYPEGAKV
jgi:hypothetical protein